MNNGTITEQAPVQVGKVTWNRSRKNSISVLHSANVDGILFEIANAVGYPMQATICKDGVSTTHEYSLSDWSLKSLKEYDWLWLYPPQKAIELLRKEILI